MVYSSGRLYLTGGISYYGGIVEAMKVYSAPASGTGTVGAWTTGTALPEAVFYHAGAAANGFVYVLGGYHYTDAAGMVLSDAVYYAKVGADGGLGTWQSSVRLPQPVFFPSAAVWNGRIYVTGGCNGSALINAVYSAVVNQDGSLGPWTAQKPLPWAVYTHTEVSNGTLYVLGGIINGGNDIQNAVYFAKINADGTLADWAAASPLPQPIANHAAVLANGRLFVMGGWTGNVPTDAVNSAAVAADGTLGGWSAESALPRPLYMHAAASDGSHVFVSGGNDPDTMRAEVYSMPLPLPPPPPPPADTLPPRTSLAFVAPTFGPIPFISPATPATLTAVDDALVVGDGAGVGVASTQWALDGGPFAAYTVPIHVSSDGSHWIRYLSVDLLGHAETVRASSAAVDGTAPVSALSAGAPQAVLADGSLIVGPNTLLAVSAADPVVNGVASGVAWVLAGVDGGALAASTAPFVLPAADGAHSVSMQAADNVGNTELVHAAKVSRDGTPPVTTLAFSAAPYTAPSGPIYSASTVLTFAAVDPVSGGVAAGVNHTEYALDGGSTTVYGGAFGAAEGAHALSYHSVDNVGNAEAARGVSFAVDATPPQTTLTLSGGTNLFGADVLTTAAALSLSATDPVSNGIASGVNRVVYSIDGGTDQAYAAPFHLAVGAHTISYGAIDNAGNAETHSVASLSVGTFLADALAGLDSVSLSGGAGVTGSVRTNGAFTADGKSTVTGDVAALTADLNGKSSVSGSVTQGQATLSSSYDLTAAAAWARMHNNNAALPASALSGGALTLTGGTFALPAGDYYLTGLSLSGQASLTVSGRVNIFLHGPLSVSGGAELNAAGEANSLWLVADAGDASLSGNSSAAFNLYAPLSGVSIAGGGQFAGRILAKTASLSGKALQPSTSSLPPAQHVPGAAAHSSPPAALTGAGTAGAGHAAGGDSSVTSSRLDSASPSVAASGPSAPSAGAPEGPAPSLAPSSPAARVAASRMPSFALAARAAFSVVGGNGNAVRAKDGSAVVIPAGAVTGGLGVTVSPAATSDILENNRRAAVESSKGLVAAGAGMQYGPEGTQFAVPVTLELPYDRAHLPAGVAENDLAVHYWNPVAGDWEKLASSVDAQNQIVRAQTSHFSLYRLFAGGGSTLGAQPLVSGDPAFTLHDAYVFPNPARGAGAVTIRFQAGLADSVEVHVYDLAGRKVHSSSDFTLNTGLDDGNGKGPQYTYDHVWNISGVGSGVYTYVITAKKAGQADIHKTGKIGVVK